MTPRTHVLAIAVENYLEKCLSPIAYAGEDARRFVSAWQELGADPNDCIVLVNEQATIETINTSIRRFARRMQPDDRAIVLVSGHGIADTGTSYFAVYDTRTPAIATTGLSLRYLLDEIEDSKASDVLFFVDAWRGIGLESRSELQNGEAFDAHELSAYCKANGSRAAFTACRWDQKAFTSIALKQSIWIHCLAQAITGHAKIAQEKSEIITASSLQAYLGEEVPRILLNTVATSDKQTPCLWAQQPDDLIVARFDDIKLQRQFDFEGVSNIIKDSSLIGEHFGKVRQLSGYTKPKVPLASHNSWERNFVANAGHGEVSLQATEIVDALRSLFRYKRKDISFSNLDSVASIRVPDFDVHVTLAQDSDEADKYVLTTEVASFRRPEVINDDNFIEIFSKYCNKVVVELGANIDLESKIDAIEEIDALAEHLEYDPECTEFTLRMPNSRMIIHATSKRIVFSLDGHSDLRMLLDQSIKAISQLASASIIPGLPSQST